MTMIVLYNPAGRCAAAYRDMVNALLAALSELGLPVRVSERLDPDEVVALSATRKGHVYVLFGSHNIEFYFNWRLRYAVFNYEQVQASSHWVGAKHYEAILRRACAVWDYSYFNQAYLAQRGIQARVLPLGYHSVLECQRTANIETPRTCQTCETTTETVATSEKVSNTSEALAVSTTTTGTAETSDILFFGSVTARRQQIIAKLRASGLTVEWLTGCWSLPERHAQWQRAKLVLNIHNADCGVSVFEQSRTVPAVANHRLVVSECSGDVETERLYENMIVFADSVDDLVSKCRTYARDDQLRRDKAEQCYRNLRDSLSYTALVKRAGFESILQECTRVTLSESAKLAVSH